MALDYCVRCRACGLILTPTRVRTLPSIGIVESDTGPAHARECECGKPVLLRVRSQDSPEYLSYDEAFALGAQASKETKA